MKTLGKIILVTILVIVCVSFSDKIDIDDIMCSKELTNDNELKDGDIIFHTSTSSQSNMLKIATTSRLTHVGVIFMRNNKPYVFEAVQPVKITPLSEFIARGADSKYKIMRYNKPLSKTDINKALKYSRKQLGKSYDIRFQWSNDKMYCSELVWKVYKEMGIELCPTKKFSDFNINNIIVKKVIETRFKNVKFDENETVVAPTNIAESYDLTTVFDTY
jgi:uncharacterized protein YycO